MYLNNYDVSDSPEWNHCLNLLLDDDYSEIEANGPDDFYTKKKGKRIKIDEIKLGTGEKYLDGIKKGLVPHIKSAWPFKENSYLFEGPLRYTAGEKLIRGRCHIVLPPAADYPQITIAKKSTALPSLESIAERGSLSTEMLTFLLAAIAGNLTMAISGGTGAGKDIHSLTALPTPTGMRKLADLEVGDFVLDEHGAPTRILNKYAPMDPKHYELTFKNGETIRAGMGHLWKVQLLNSKVRYGGKVKPLFSAAVRAKIEAELSQAEDEYMFSGDVFSLLDTDKSNSPLGQEMKGLGFKADEFFSFPTAELYDLVSRTTIYGDEKKNMMLERIEAHGTTMLTLGEFRACVQDRSVFRRLLPGVPTGSTKVFNRRELLTHLLHRDDLRTAARDMRDLSAVEAQRPSVLMTTEELFAMGAVNENGRLNFAIERMDGAAEFTPAQLPIEPYALGAWLGDGLSGDGRVCGVDEEVLDGISKTYTLTHSRTESKPDRMPLHTWSFAELYSLLRDFGLLNNKHVPEVYRFGSPAQRSALLAGLVDTDGSVSSRSGMVEIGMTNRAVVEAAHAISVSLGWHTTPVNRKPSAYKAQDGSRVPCKDSYNFSFVPHALEELPLQVARKRANLAARFDRAPQQASRHERHYITDIQEIADQTEDYFCIEVDSPTHMFLATESLIPTHNTTMLEALAKHFRHDQRIGVAEDAPELYLSQPNVTYLHSVPYQPGMNPNDVARLSWVVQQFQRMRTDKLIIGETRGEEFADFLVAANSGMDGSMTTLHANNAVQCLDKMTNFAIKASNAPVRTINTDIANSIDLIVQLIILPNGGHRTSQICEVTNTLATDDTARITTNVLYSYDKKTDSFIKESQMTDALRRRLESSGIDIRPFLVSQVGARSAAHSNAEVAQDILNKAAPGQTLGLPTLPTGIPTGPGRRTL